MLTTNEKENIGNPEWGHIFTAIQRRHTEFAFCQLFQSVWDDYKPGDEMDIVEFGIGRGYALSVLLPHVSGIRSYTGLEINPLAYFRASQIASKLKLYPEYKDVPISLKIQSMYHCDIPSNSADIVFGLSSFDSIDNLQRAFSEANRILRPGGRLLLIQDILPDEGIYRSDPGYYNQCLKTAVQESPLALVANTRRELALSENRHSPFLMPSGKRGNVFCLTPEGFTVVSHDYTEWGIACFEVDKESKHYTIVCIKNPADEYEKQAVDQLRFNQELIGTPIPDRGVVEYKAIDLLVAEKPQAYRDASISTSPFQRLLRRLHKA